MFGAPENSPVTMALIHDVATCTLIVYTNFSTYITIQCTYIIYYCNKSPKTVFDQANFSYVQTKFSMLDIMTEQCLMVIFGSVTLQDWSYAMNSLVFISSLSIGHHALLLVYQSLQPIRIRLYLSAF